MIYRTRGIIRAAPPGQKSGWFYLECDPEISQYYHWLYSRGGFTWEPPMNGTHVTFISGEKDARIVSTAEMEKWVGMDADVEYYPLISTNGRAFWMQAFSWDLDWIRRDMNLPPMPRGYHITLGNVKNRK